MRSFPPTLALPGMAAQLRRTRKKHKLKKTAVCAISAALSEKHSTRSSKKGACAVLRHAARCGRQTAPKIGEPVSSAERPEKQTRLFWEDRLARVLSVSAGNCGFNAFIQTRIPLERIPLPTRASPQGLGLASAQLRSLATRGSFSRDDGVSIQFCNFCQENAKHHVLLLTGWDESFIKVKGALGIVVDVAVVVVVGGGGDNALLWLLLLLLLWLILLWMFRLVRFSAPLPPL